MLYLRITISGKRVNVSTGLDASLGRWNQDKQKFTGGSEAVRQANARLDDLKTHAMSIFYDLERQNEDYTMRQFLHLFKGLQRKHYLSDELINFIQSKSTRTDISENTKKNARLQAKIIQEYIKEHNKDILIRDVDYRYAEQFKTWCLNARGYSHAHTNKLIQCFKQTMQHAHIHNRVDKNELENYKTGLKLNVSITALNPAEVKRLYGLQLPDRLARVRDLFVVQCLTGLAYSDLMRLNPGMCQDNCIHITRQKTSSSAIIPILEPVFDILSYYTFNLPRISNVKYNEYLKQLALAADLEQHLTTHVGRKTFATMLLNSGIDERVRYKVMGWKVGKIEQVYADVMTQRIVDEFDRKLKYFNRSTQCFQTIS